MHHLQTMFSRGFNRRTGRTGSLWQSRYQANLVDEGQYLWRVVLYVHLNPVRAGVVANPAAHVFSGHREIVRRVKRSLVDVEDALLCFGDTVRSARRAYSAAMRAGVEEARGEQASEAASFRSLRWRDRELRPKPGQEHVDVLGRSTGRERPGMAAEDFVARLCRLLGTDVERLAGRFRDRETAELRRIIATLGVERWGKRGKDLAGVLHTNPDVVSWWVGEGVRRRREDPEFAAKLDELDEALSRETSSAELS